MNDDTKPGISAGDRAGDVPGGPAGSSAAPTTTIRPQLLRSTEDRMVSGVCGGLGEHFGLDPVIFRIVFAVLSLFGGVGVLVYSLGWLSIPARGEEQPMLRRILAGKFDYGASAATVVAVMGVALFFTYLDSGFGPSVPLLMITAVVLFMVWSDTKKKQQAAVDAAGVAAMASAPAQVDTRPDDATVPGPPMWWQVPGAGSASGDEEPPAQAPAPQRPRCPRSYVSLATLSVATMVGGLLWVLDHTGAVEVTFTVAIAILLGIVGLGLLAGTWFGRARLLILPALALTALLTAVTAISVPLTGPSGERTYTPTTVAALPASYRLGVGTMDIDLRRLDLGPGGSATVKARIGAGQIQVWVPDDVTVVFKGGVDLGQVRTPTGRDDGYRPERTETTAPAVGPGRGTITLDLKVGVGDVELLDGDDGREPR
ncbi:PspC domain-containing protein [Embleya scabrispora]|uniref:PspC domain-containing protein n=1 Tax=Embleya scabrispora TaxID=159449 RepID=UPI00037DFD59|nr:PspC domain-containing protein [Embleya scabrispora]MYS80127.1 PspC domain-containing protein [Streptomyces sp. SID5474]